MLNFNSQLKVMPDFLKHRNDLRFTIDDTTDFELLKGVFQFHKENKYNIEKPFCGLKNPLLLNNMVANIKKNIQNDLYYWRNRAKS